METTFKDGGYYKYDIDDTEGKLSILAINSNYFSVNDDFYQGTGEEADL